LSANLSDVLLIFISHTEVHNGTLPLSLKLCFSACLSVALFLSLPLCLSVYLSVYMSVCLFHTLILSVTLSHSLSISFFFLFPFFILFFLFSLPWIHFLQCSNIIQIKWTHYIIIFGSIFFIKLFLFVCRLFPNTSVNQSCA